LPFDLPPSYNDDSHFGLISYSVNILWKPETEAYCSIGYFAKKSFPFFVKPDSLDLNPTVVVSIIRNLTSPISTMPLKELFALMKEDTHCQFKLSVLKEGRVFVPGEKIPFQMEMINLLCKVKEVMKGIVNLKREVEFRVRRNVARTEVVLCSKIGPTVLYGEGKVWRWEGAGDGITVPKDAFPSGPPGCGIISVKYFLEVSKLLV
jgi:hypothetical protein